ncbi:MAG: c-type cytochrome [Deltaproteobacteria bacterium]|nr:c-type cytochrome [Deltaproteobacteria bacterium]
MGRVFFLLIAVLNLVTGCLASPQDSSEAPLTRLEEQGWKIFSREPCFSACHVTSVAATAPGSLGGFVPDLRKTPRRAPDWYLAYFVNPREVLPYSPMPSFGYLSRDEMKALAAFLQRLNRDVPAPKPRPVPPEEIPRTAKDFASYAAGRKVFNTYCAGCHGEPGNGGGSVGHLLAPEPRDFTDAIWMSKQTESYLFSIITDGKPNTAMPGFKDILRPQERALALNYIQYFADPVSKERMELAFTIQ